MEKVCNRPRGGMKEYESLRPYPFRYFSGGAGGGAGGKGGVKGCWGPKKFGGPQGKAGGLK